MKKYFLYIGIAFTLSICAYAKQYTSLTENVNQLIKSNGLNSASIAIKVLDASTGENVFSLNEYKNHMPASNTKLVTAVSALLVLGQDYQYQTKLYYDSKVSSTEIHNLYIDFSGDPSLTTKSMTNLLQALVRANIKNIKGDVFLVNRFFQGRDYPINQSQSDSIFGYGAPSSIYNLNENAVALSFTPKVHGFDVKQVEGESIIYQNEVVAANDKMLKTCQFNAKSDQNNVLILAGCLPKVPYTFRLAIQDPTLMMQTFVKQKIKALEIGLVGEVRITTSLPEKAKQIATHFSPKLSVLTKHMLQTSDNLYAQTLVRTIGYYHYGVGSIVAGKNAMLEILKDKLDLDVSSIQLEDGAGMSANNLLSTDFLSDLLYKMQTQKVFDVFEQALPVYTKNAIPAHRKNEWLKGKVIAKTGTGTTVSALSGYLCTKDRKRYVFSILISDLTNHQRKTALVFQSQFLESLYELKFQH